MPRTLIVGGGISGLSTAFALLEESRRLGTEHELVVLEAEPRPGGKIYTERTDGYQFEWGPEGFLDNSPPTLELCRDLGLGERLLRASAAAKRRFLYLEGRLLELPSSPPRFFTSPMLPLRARLRILLEPFIRRGRGEETVASFASRRLGPEAARTLVDAMVTGIYGGDPAELSVDAAFPRLKKLEAEHGSLVRGALALGRQRRREAKKSGAAPAAGAEGEAIQTGPSGTLTSLPGGLGELIEALALRLGPERLRTGVRVGALRVIDGRPAVEVDGETLAAEQLVLSVPPGCARPLVAGVSSELDTALGALEITASIAVVGLGWRREALAHPLDGFGFLVPGRERLPLLGCLFSSSIFEGRAPEGRVLLRAMLGGRRQAEIVSEPDERIVQRCLEILRPQLGLRGEPDLLRVVRWSPAIPQYTLGHQGRVAAAERAAAAVPGLHLAGNALHGVAMNDCIRHGLELGRRLAAPAGGA
jgi:protoporphyrinogen/coproporphyrinogen III oxidase